MSNTLKEQLIGAIDSMEHQLIHISDYIHAHPEPAFKEYKAVAILTQELERAGFQVERNILGMETAFMATYKGARGGPVLGIIAEYDALPMGHACGHNIIGTTAVGAGIALSRFMDRFPGSIIIFGTPAEEAGGGKLPFCEKGLFSQAQAAILVHPGDKTVVESSSLAIDSIEFTYQGKAAHAAACPHQGINALDGVLMLFNSINALRQQLKDEVRIHGIISEGGTAPNIIPEKAVARFYVRAQQREYLDEVVDRVLGCAQGAAQATACLLTHWNYQPSYENMMSNPVLAATFKENLISLGEKVSEPEKEGMMGSTDMGNVSHILPSIHPSVAISPEGIGGHTREFMESAASESGHRGLMLGVKATALTAVDLFTDADLMARMMEAFEKTV